MLFGMANLAAALSSLCKTDDSIVSVCFLTINLVSSLKNSFVMRPHQKKTAKASGPSGFSLLINIRLGLRFFLIFGGKVKKNYGPNTFFLDESGNPRAVRVVVGTGYVGPEWVWPKAGIAEGRVSVSRSSPQACRRYKECSLAMSALTNMADFQSDVLNRSLSKPPMGADFKAPPFGWEFFTV